ncbi:MAG: NUDIX hydrolase [Desulfopila sp.]
MTTLPGEELVQIVDQHNLPIGARPRRIMRQQGLIHRASYILVFNSRGELFVQKRTMAKDIYPGYWEIAAGGVTLAGESDDDSAHRELREELGIAAVDLEFLFHHYHQSADNRVWGAVYRCCHDGPFRLQPEEVEYGEFVPMLEVLRRMDQVDFTPDSPEILDTLIGSSRAVG